MSDLRERTDKDLQHLIGTRIELLDAEGKRHVGILDFAGINNLHGEFQATVSRCPIWPVVKDSIKPFEVNKMF